MIKSKRQSYIIFLIQMLQTIYLCWNTALEIHAAMQLQLQNFVILEMKTLKVTLNNASEEYYLNFLMRKTKNV